MGKTGTATRDKLVAVAGDLFQRQGYTGTGLNQILAEGELPRGSLYFHFPGGKEAIGVAAIAAGRDQVMDLLTMAGAEAVSLPDFLQRCAAGFSWLLQHSNYTKGCPVTAIALEMADKSEAIRLASQQAFTAWQQALADRFIGFGLAQSEAGRFATVALASFEGALTLSRTLRSTAPLQLTCDALITLSNNS